MQSRNQIQQEIIDSLTTPIHGLLNLAPRVGKTKIGIDIIKKEKAKKILWVTPNTKLRDEDIPIEFKQWKALSYLNKTTIICYASLAEHKGKYDKIILDEYQDITSTNAEPLFNGNIKYNTIIGLSGTHPKHKEKQDIYSRLNLKILVSISIDEAVEKNLIAPYKITVIECKLNNKDRYVLSGSKKVQFYQTEKAKYEYLSKSINLKLIRNEIVPRMYYLRRMKFLYNLKSKNTFAKNFIKKLTGRTLVFTGSIEQAEFICDKTYHSKTDNKDLKDFLEGKINTLACVNSGGTGFTYKNVDNFVIVQVNSDKKGDATQKIARSLVLQEEYVANIFILVVADTVDETWKDKVLENFDKEKIKHVSYKNYE